MRWYTDAAGCEQVSFSWRSMPPDTGGRGSYGHRHPGQEEIYFVLEGTVTFKVGDEVFEVGPKTAVRMSGEEPYSVHNDTDDGRRAAPALDPRPQRHDRAGRQLLARRLTASGAGQAPGPAGRRGVGLSPYGGVN